MALARKPVFIKKLRQLLEASEAKRPKLEETKGSGDGNVSLFFFGT